MGLEGEGGAPVGPARATSCLDVCELTVDFGGVRALDGASLSLAPGELVGLIGPNGAGKTTLIDAVTGFVGYRGRVHAGPRCLDGASPHRRVSAGVTRTWQSLELFDDLTVLENCIVGERRAAGEVGGGGPEGAAPERSRGERAKAALAQVGLESHAHRHPTELSLGQRKLVAVARALAAEPTTVLLDEPAAGLDTGESAALGVQLRATADRGIAMLLVDHDMRLVLGVCDRVVVLEFGRVIAQGEPEEVRADPAVVEAYLGASHRPVRAVAP